MGPAYEAREAFSPHWLCEPIALAVFIYLFQS